MSDFSLDGSERLDIPDRFDVLVVGAGAAGLYTALCLPAHLRVGLITKDALSRSASDWAQGGIAAVVDSHDSTALHLEDTLKAGAGLCDYDAVKFLVENAATCIHNLVEMGVAFDRDGSNLALTLEAAHSRRRVLHAADTTGRAVVTTLTEQVLSHKNIQILSQAFVLDLWLDPQSQRCQGVSLIYQGQVCWIRAGAVVLATGGGGQVFAQTTNPAVSTGDGVAIAHRAGATLRDLEFVQFHPTALTKAGAPRFLISEAVRGEGAHLVDRHGHRFAFDYHPAGELAPRDVVSRAIFNHLQKTEADPAIANVWLDLRPIPAETIRHRFPNIIQVCQHWGINVFQEPIPVAPAAHYWMGGVEADILNQTSILGLYAVGETASTGVHGANRLASNSLLECLVFGAQLTHLKIESDPLKRDEASDSPNTFHFLEPFELDKIQTLRAELPKLIWQNAGICREEMTLDKAIAQVKVWRQEFFQLSLSQALISLNSANTIRFAADADPSLKAWGELYNLLDVADLILKSAQFRTESRGGHYRSDYPRPSSDWQVHTVVQGDRWDIAPVKV
ncbi:L-aspartate oxidase [Phormidesmis priestleyi]|uniref:L-aspartate oxidase n=1 Tax=Phormidesmis priestleyi TaxID=268141 RepID=UPI00083AF861|nr:L-aspartate oxidase [Phormidesmis priestleyi]